MNFKKIKLLISVFLTAMFISCTGEDKHPDIPVFTESLLEEYNYEKVNYNTYYLGKTAQLHFFKHTIKDTSFIKVTDIQTGDLIASLNTSHNSSRIDKWGNIYLKSIDTIYKHSPPYFKRDTIHYVELVYPTYKELKIKYHDNIKGFSYRKEINFLDAVRDTIVKGKYFYEVDSIFKFTNSQIIFNTKTKAFFTNCNFLDEGGVFATRKSIFNFQESKNLHNLPEKKIVESRHLEKFDEVTLDYSLESANHMVISIIPEELNYYNFTHNNKTIQFKTSSAEERRDFEGNLLLYVGDMKYKIN